MLRTPSFPLRVFYDGGCGICNSEMRTYRSRNSGGRLIFIDIRSPRFDPSPYGISKVEFLRELHAIDAEGNVYRSVDAFRAIWKAFPGYGRYEMLEGLVNIPGINYLARLSYRVFARIRKHFPVR
jgi:predicted DCC family thiol-disulfide oxidoreductase YuxK